MIGGEALFGPYKDGELPNDEETRRYVMDVIRKVQPGRIITHWKTSIHKDHANTHAIVNDALLLASLFRWNRVSATLGSLVMNPLTTPFFWSLSGTVGAAIFHADAKKVLHSVRNGESFHSLTAAAGIYLAGNLVVALVFSVGAYFVALRAVTLYRRKKRERRMRLRESG